MEPGGPHKDPSVITRFQRGSLVAAGMATALVALNFISPIEPAGQPNERTMEAAPLSSEQIDLENTQAVLDKYERARSIHSDYDTYLAKQRPGSFRDFASKKFHLNFFGMGKDLNGERVRDPYRGTEKIRSSVSFQGAVEAANEVVHEYGFRFELPDKPIAPFPDKPNNVFNPIEPEDISVDEIGHWLVYQIYGLESIPKDVIELSELKTVYLVKSLGAKQISGMASFDTQSIFADLGGIKGGLDSMYIDSNLVAHELGHLLHAKLVKLGLINNKLMWELANQQNVADLQECAVLANFDRPDAAKNVQEETAAIFARMFRSEPLAPKGRKGLGLSSAYALQALGQALPATDVVDYFIALGKYPLFMPNDSAARDLNTRWTDCQVTPVVPTTQVAKK